MLIRVSIENFMSFRERTEISMVPGKGRIHGHQVSNSTDRNDIPVLKTGIIYGANASGKSNLVKAIDFVKKMVIDGTKTESQRINFRNFRLDEKTLNSPSRIEFEIKHKSKNYAYGFMFDTHNIIEEWLFEIFKNKEDRKIFDRTLDEKGKSQFDFKGIKVRSDKEKQFLEFTANGTRKNQLFISECRVRNVKDNVIIDDILLIIDWFLNSLKVIFPDSKYGGLEFELRDNQQLAKIFQEFLDHFNTGIQGIEMIDVDIDKIGIPEAVKEKLFQEDSETTEILLSSPRGVTYAIKKDEDNEMKVMKMMTKRKLINSERFELFEIKEESDGTQRLIDFIPAMIDLLKGDNVYVIDEIDRSLHPNLTYEFIDLFLSKSEGINSQLLITTHESSILSQKILRKDEIWFVIKDSFGASSFYSLEEFKVRFDKEIRKDYLFGRYRAVPEFGSRTKLSIFNE